VEKIRYEHGGLKAKQQVFCAPIFYRKFCSILPAEPAIHKAKQAEALGLRNFDSTKTRNMLNALSLMTQFQAKLDKKF